MKQLLICMTLVAAACGCGVSRLPETPEANPALDYRVSVAFVTFTDMQLQGTFGLDSGKKLLKSLPEQRSEIGKKLLSGTASDGAQVHFFTNSVLKAKGKVKVLFETAATAHARSFVLTIGAEGL